MRLTDDEKMNRLRDEKQINRNISWKELPSLLKTWEEDEVVIMVASLEESYTRLASVSKRANKLDAKVLFTYEFVIKEIDKLVPTPPLYNRAGYLIEIDKLLGIVERLQEEV